MPRQPCVYIMASQRNGTIYTGVTSNLIQRVWQHRNHVTEGFTASYGVTKLVYYELQGSMYEAILREKRIKNWKRIWKIELIEGVNPNWDDMFLQIIQ